MNLPPVAFAVSPCHSSQASQARAVEPRTWRAVWKCHWSFTGRRVPPRRFGRRGRQAGGQVDGEKQTLVDPILYRPAYSPADPISTHLCNSLYLLRCSLFVSEVWEAFSSFTLLASMDVLRRGSRRPRVGPMSVHVTVDRDVVGALGASVQ